ncbi:MAG: 3'-5' exonuclease domain-containing protein 2 [Desulfovibrionaceae bacterium]|nr:3'-5' exonuclease domain-containing protein 2 [Desulfovibrionaceae bacterium]
MNREIHDTYKRIFSNEEINALPLRRYQGEIVVVRTEDQRRSAVRRLGRERVLGFDTETRPVFKKGLPQNPPSLVQLAGEATVFVFQIGMVGLSDGLVNILSDPRIVKTGVSVHDDLKALRDLAPFKDHGFVDLGEAARETGMLTHGLRNLAANLLGFRISKAAQCSNWGRENLSAQQITYAATDAWVSRKIYLAMLDIGALQPPGLRRPALKNTPD